MSYNKNVKISLKNIKNRKHFFAVKFKSSKIFFTLLHHKYTQLIKKSFTFQKSPKNIKVTAVVRFFVHNNFLHTNLFDKEIMSKFKNSFCI